MRRLKRQQYSIWRSVLTVFLSMVLALGGLPAVPVSAEDLTTAQVVPRQTEASNTDELAVIDDAGTPATREEADETAVDEGAGEQRETGSLVPGDAGADSSGPDEPSASDAQDESYELDAPAGIEMQPITQQPDGQQDVPEKGTDEEKQPADNSGRLTDEAADEHAPDEPTYTSGKLSQKIKVDDKHYYKVSVVYGKEACIPEGAELHVSVPDLHGTKRQRKQRLGQILELEDGDRILGAKYLDVTIEADGHIVEPTSEVKVAIRTNAIKAARSTAVEIALGMEGESGNKDERHIIPENRSKDKKGAHTRLVFATQSLGRIALASVVRPLGLWTGEGLEVSLLAPRYGLTLSIANAETPSLDEGVDPLACYAVQVDHAPAYGTVLWIGAHRIAAPEADEDAAAPADVVAYRLRSGASDKRLFGAEGTKRPMAFRAGDTLLVVRDSGYRNTTLSLSDVTVEGMMPEGAHGTARDVTKRYEDPAALLHELDADAALEVEEGAREVSTIAAYDIALKADGGAYQPDEEHPLTVTITNGAIDEAIFAGKQVQVWHVAADGAVEVIEDCQIGDGTVTFEAPGFSDYLLVAQSETDVVAEAEMGMAAQAVDETEAVATSTTFSIKAVAGTYARASLVTFIDTDGNPLRGTVTGTLEVTYTGGGSEANETNSIDMYSFIDKLDPAITDEYDFSRVYVQLRNDQKDFRRIMVGDNTAIGNSNAYPQRAYFHMNDVSENAAGHDYNGTWYQLNIGGKMDDIYIEFYHVAPVSFRAIDTRNDPVQGATFALYTDPECYTPYEYKNEEVTAVADERGAVSFGKIPRGTYYMKETVIPEGYKKSTNIYTVVVDGETPIADVVHEDDDGSIIISDVLKMRLTKEWTDGKAHESENVEVTVYARGEAIATVTLNAENEWTQVLEGLDPNEAYMVSESKVTRNGSDVTKSWIPTIECEEKDPHVEYYKADEFKKGRQYVIITTTYSGTRALSGASSLVTTPLEVSADGSQITGTVTDGLLWNVESLTQDGVIALRNEQSGLYLDQNGKWYLNPSYPVPLYVRHSNDDGFIRFYHRANMNNATAYYLYMHYGPNSEGQVDRYWNDASKAGVFELYRKVNVRNVDVTITNKATEYPIRIKNVSYPQGAALPGMTYDLYEQENYSEANPGTPLMNSLTANADGYLENAETGDLIELIAGSYALVQTSTLEDEGYSLLTKPIKFTITRRGALRVALDDQEFDDFEYSTTMTEGELTIPVLQVPNDKSCTFELTLNVQGDYADLERPFAFELAMPEGVSALRGTLDGNAIELDEEHCTFELKHGQTLRLEGVPAATSYVFTQTDGRVAAVKQDGDRLYGARAQATPAVGTQSTVTVVQQADDERVVTISDLRGTSDDPARVTITNTLSNVDVPPTGLADNASAWLLVVQLCACALAALLLRRMHSGLHKSRT